MRARKAAVLLGGIAVAGFVAAQAVQGGTPLEVGVEAPDFSLPSATSEGLGPPVRLSDYRGRTVVLAFFFRARTPG